MSHYVNISKRHFIITYDCKYFSDTLVILSIYITSSYHFIVTLRFFLGQNLIFVAVFFNSHCTLYCVNKIHGQIEILDPQKAVQKSDRDKYHMRFCLNLRENLHLVLSAFTDGMYGGDISCWDMPYINLQNQITVYDCVFFCMFYMEQYNGARRHLDINIDPVGLLTCFFFFCMSFCAE